MASCFRWATPVAAVVVLSASVSSRADAPASCDHVVGRARAVRMAHHCSYVTSATHPPCNVANLCSDIVEHTRVMCAQFSGKPPPFCAEYPPNWTPTVAPPALEAKRLATTLAGDLAEADAARAEALRASSRLDAIVTKKKALAAKVKSDQADLKKHLQAAKAARAKYDAKARSGNGPADVLKTARDELAAAAGVGETLKRELAELTALQSEIGQGAANLDAAKRDSVPALEAKETASLLGSVSSDAKKAAARDKTPAAAAAAEEVKAAAEQANAKLKELQGIVAEQKKTAQAALAKAGSSAARSAEQAKTFKDSQALPADLAALGRSLGEVKTALQTAAQGSVFGGNAACDVQKVDFHNYTFPDDPKSFKNGKAVGGSYTGASIDKVDYADLDGDGSKEAVVYTRMPGAGPHGDDAGSLQFFGYDAQCNLRRIERVDGGVSPGQAKAKSYVYRSVIYGTPAGMAGNFAAGLENVEVRVVGGKLKETKRTPAQ